MPPTARHYDRANDYERVNAFLRRHDKLPNGHVNWCQPRWEYMHFHPLIWDVDLSVNGVWEEDGEIVGLVHLEHFHGDAYFEFHPHYVHLQSEMLAWAEAHLTGGGPDGRFLKLWINDEDAAGQALARAAGYTRTEHGDPMACFDVPTPFPSIALPAGFSLRSLADDNDLRKVDRVLWRGFNHGDEPPEDGDGLKGRAFMQSAPNYRHDLNIVAVAPEGHFVAYCGMWMEPGAGRCYVEPVATDPDYRRMGLGAAAVLEGIRRCALEGARAAWVGSTQPFYRSLGFHQRYRSTIWERRWGGLAGAR